MMEELKLGIAKAKDLAEWFHISPSAYYNSKQKRLEELKQYCKFEDLGKKGINIIEIYNPQYQTKAKQRVKQIFDELFQENEDVEWGQDQNHIDTATHFANKIVQKYGNCGVQFNTLVVYTHQEKKLRYGKNSSRKIKAPPGNEGSSKYVFCKQLDDGSYVEFTDEEKQIKRELYHQLNLGDNDEDLEEMFALKDAFNKHEITEQEYVESCYALKQDKWYTYLAALEEKLNCRCTFATHLTKND